MASSLQIAGINKRFGKGDKSVEVLHKVDIHVAPGEFLILVGPSGCGKSTLLNIIAGLDAPTEGEVRIGGLVLVHCLAGMAGTTLFFRNYYTAVPRELVNAARIDGAGFWRIFWRIVLPMSTPIMMVTLIWQFTNIWNDFLFGVAFSGADSKPVTVGLNNMANTTSSVKNYNVDMAAAIIAGLPTMLVYVLAGQYFVKGLTAGAVKG